jgi:hypothetical protein
MELRIFDSANNEAVPWGQLRDELRPESIDPDAWNVIYANVQSNVGPTWGSFVQMLSENAQYLGRLGEHVVDVGQLWSFEVQQAIGFNPIQTLASSVDAAVTSAGADLTFGRSFALGIDQRFETSRFGRGWSVPWDTRLAIDSATGAATIVANGGSNPTRETAPSSRPPSGTPAFSLASTRAMSSANRAARSFASTRLGRLTMPKTRTAIASRRRTMCEMAA